MSIDGPIEFRTTGLDLVDEGRQVLAAAQLMPLLAHDMRTVVRAQIDCSAGHENAAAIVWALNRLPELLDRLSEALQLIQAAGTLLSGPLAERASGD